MSYETRAVTLLALVFGLVGLDRWVIAPLFPAMVTDLDLDYQNLGTIVGALGVAWGVSSLVMGRLSDKLGRKKVLIPAIVLFSLCSALTGLAGGLMSLLLIRALIAGTITVESVPRPLMATAVGTVIGVAEIFGGGVAPAIAGYLAQNYGIQYTLYLALGGLVVALVATVLLAETAPRKTAGAGLTEPGTAVGP